MIYQSKVFALARSITYKSIWTAFAMNQPIIELGLEVPDNKKKWRYFMHLAGDKHEVDETLLIDSLDTNQVIPLNRESLNTHKKTATFYRERENREKLHELFPLYPLYIDGLFEPVPYELSISAEDGDILRYDSDLIEEQEVSLLFELEKRIKAEHHLYFMESYAAAYPAFTLWFISKLSAMIPGFIKEIRLRKIHTVETHSEYIREFLRSHKGLDGYLPYLSTKQMLFLYRNIRYIERNAARQDTFEFLVENLLTERAIPLDGYDFSEMYTDMANGGLERIPVCFKTPLNFPERVLGRDVEIFSLDHVLDKEEELGVLHERLLDDYRVEAKNQANRASILTGPTKLLEVSGVDPESLRSESFIDRVVYDWAYFAGTGQFLSNVDLIDPQSGNNIRLSALEAFCVFMYAYYKGYHETEIKRIPPFSCSEQENGVWYGADDYRKGLISYPSLYREDHINYFIETHKLMSLPIYDSLEFYNSSYNRWKNKGNREYYLGSQRNDFDRGIVEYLYRFTYQDRFIEHELTGKDYNTFLYEKGFQVGDFTTTIWKDLCTDLLKLAVGYDPEAVIGFAEIQKKLMELFQKLSSYTIQLSSRYGSSESITVDPTCALVQQVLTESESTGYLRYNIDTCYKASYEEGNIFAPVIGNDLIEATQVGIPTIQVNTGLGVSAIVREEIELTVNYESSATATFIEN